MYFLCLLFRSSVRIWKSSMLLCFVLSLSLHFFTSFWAADRWEQLTRWCSSLQRKHFKDCCDWWWCNWSLSKFERLLQWWLILRLFCLQSVRLCSFSHLTYSAIFVVFNCTFFSCNFWSFFLTSDLFCTSMTSWMTVYSSNSNWSKTWKQHSDLNKLLMSFCIMMIFQVNLTRCVHVFSMKIFVDIL